MSRTIICALAIVYLSAFPNVAFAQQKVSKSPAKQASTCSYDECVSGSKARGWGGSEASNWCGRNVGKCPPR